MRTAKNLYSCLILSILYFSCTSEPDQKADIPMHTPIDESATTETKALIQNLGVLSKTGILFGHQDDLAYGVMWKDEPLRSDVKESCGSYPAVFGWDVSKLGQRSCNIDSVDFEKMKDWIIQAFQWGGVNTISWHMDNPVTGGDSWDQTPAVHSIIPGGEHHEWFRQKLDLFSVFLNDLSIDNRLVPIIFRPFHEHTGNWFWWGRGNTSRDDFVKLWRFTVDYLKKEKGIHQLLYAYSTDRFTSPVDYLDFYPGDEYVDILAYDDYHSIVSSTGRSELIRQLKTIVQLSREKGKVAALSETGYETIPDEDWWTSVLLQGLTADTMAQEIAYVLVWRNARLDHHYAPYEGHLSVFDFKKFNEDPSLIFLNELPFDLYRSGE